MGQPQAGPAQAADSSLGEGGCAGAASAAARRGCRRVTGSAQPRVAAGCQAWAGGRRHPAPAGRGLLGPTRPAARSPLAGSNNVFSQAAQTHVQVLPSAAASGNSLLLPLATLGASSPGPVLGPGRGAAAGLCSLRGGRPARSGARGSARSCGPGALPGAAAPLPSR